MTTSQHIHDAHIQTAFRAAFVFGRQQYDVQNYDVSKAVRALETFNVHSTPKISRPILSDNSNVIGGGNSLSGKIMWLLENNGAMTRSGIESALGLSAPVSDLVRFLKNKGRVSIAGRGKDAVVSAVARKEATC